MCAAAVGGSAAALATALPALGAATTPGPVERISDERTESYWAHPNRVAPVYAGPTSYSEQVAVLRLETEDGLPELYLALARASDRKGEWVRIRLPRRPNGTTGWVRRHNLGRLHRVATQLVVDRSRLHISLYRAGRLVFRAPVGLGKPATPTPAGRFYIRERFPVRGAPMYGTHAIGTSAYAPTLSGWLNGGIVGIHGTDKPELIPGRPSHGCIRMRNRDIARLYRRVPLGTPLHIR